MEPSHATLSSFTCDELFDYMLEKNVSEEAITAVREEKLVGIDFLELSDDEAKELFPTMGVRKSICRLISSLNGKDSQRNHQNQSTAGQV